MLDTGAADAVRDKHTVGHHSVCARRSDAGAHRTSAYSATRSLSRTTLKSTGRSGQRGDGDCVAHQLTVLPCDNVRPLAKKFRNNGLVAEDFYKLYDISFGIYNPKVSILILVKSCLKNGHTNLH